MALSHEETKELKEQLKEQIQNLAPEKRAEAESHIDSMSPEAIEEMLAQQQSSSQKIFRMIVEKQIPSVIIGENNDAIAVLSTKSISKAHTIIIPKSAVTSEKDLPKNAYKLAEECSKKIISSLKASSAEVISEKAFGEVILNLIPIYEKPLNLKSPRKELPIEELEKIKTEINVEKINKEPEKIKLEKKVQSSLKLKRRVP